MRFTSKSQIDDLVTHRVVESASLEFKGELHLDKQSERSEALKDLSGMGNGGGGTILYGVVEDNGKDWPAARAVAPLTDFSLQARLENIVRDGMHPPLLVDYTPIEYDGGYVLAVEVRRSPVGAYMVESYGDRRFYRRVGSNVFKMSEPEVRDAYTLGLRTLERRPQLWVDHGLPLQPSTGDLWLIVSALPEEPLVDMFDMRTVMPSDLMPPREMLVYFANDWSLGDLTPLIRSLSRWMDGFHGSDPSDRAPAEHFLRVDRDGAAALATYLHKANDDEAVWTTRLYRILNTTLMYFGWLWDTFGLGSSVELRIDLHHADRCTFIGANKTADGNPTMLTVTGPPGVSLDLISTAEYILPGSVRRTSERHAMVLRFADRLHQALGEPHAQGAFRRGLLYDRAGHHINVSVHRSCIWDETTNAGHIGRVQDDGSVAEGRTSQIVGWFIDGAIVDLTGDTVAVVEFATGAAVPDDWVAIGIEDDSDGKGVRFGGTPDPAPIPATRPEPTGRWASLDLRSLLVP